MRLRPTYGAGAYLCIVGVVVLFTVLGSYHHGTWAALFVFMSCGLVVLGGRFMYKARLRKWTRR